MRKIIEVDGSEEGFNAMLGERVTVWCLNYIYAGKLVGVNTNDVKLEDASIVYETGSFNTPGYKDAQRLPGKFFYIRTALIESYGLGK